MSKKIIAVLLLPLLVFSLFVISRFPKENNISAAGGIAFPGAEGFGANTVGGRGGKVYEVTNTNDSGTGSLRNCVIDANNYGARTCIFKVGGLITLNSALTITKPNLTIAGQTAPGGGITIKLGSSEEAFQTMANEVIIRYLTIRSGSGGSNHTNQIAENGKELSNIIVDHNSLSWGVDSNIETWYRVKNATIQWSIISEGLNCSTHDKGCHSKGIMIGGYSGSDSKNSLGSENISVLNNLMAHNVDRNPLMQMCGPAQVINNITYNAATTFSHQQLNCKGTGYEGTSYVNWINNYHKKGPSGSNTDLKIIPSDAGVCSSGKVYMSGNVGNNGSWTYQLKDSCSGRTDIVVSTPVSAPTVSTSTALNAYNSILAEGGAGNSKYIDCNGNWVNRRDTIDQRVVNETKNGTGKIIDDPSDVGGWITPATGTACTDSDKDGMPDGWESAKGLNPNSATDGPSYTLNSSYTNLEVYINGLSPSSGSSDSTAPTVSITSPANGSTIDINTATTISASASDNVGVTKVEFYNGSTLLGSDTSSPYSYAWTTPSSAGSVSLTAKAYDSAGNVGTSSVTISVVTPTNDTTNPTISITSPANNATLNSNSSVLITANASDNVGVSKVEFIKDGSLLCTDTTSPYSCSWTTPSTNGTVIISAKAYDAKGNSASTQISVNIVTPDNTAPSVSITSPSNGSNIEINKSVTITASASDNVGVTKVEIYKGSTLICTDTTSPYSCSWTAPSTSGTVTIVAQAYDVAGNVGTSQINITVVTPPDGISPTVSITSPANNSSVYVNTSLTTNISASDNIGVTKVELYRNSTLLCTDSYAPYTCTWITPSTNGQINVVAKAYDSAGNVGTSQIALNVTTPVDNIKPSVVIKYPTNGQSIDVAKLVSINVDANDNTGVSKVEVYSGSTKLCTDTTAPYACVWTAPSSASTVSLTAKAYDVVGNTSSNTISVFVVAPVDTTAPSISWSYPLNGSKLIASSQVTLIADAKDNVKVSKVEFYIDNKLICTDTTAQFSCSWTTPSVFSIPTLKAKAYDLSGNTSSSQIQVQVVKNTKTSLPAGSKDVNPPTVSIAVPALDSVMETNLPITIIADAMDNVKVEKVRFFYEDSLLCEDKTSQFSCAWTTPATSGPVTISAVAYDSSGNYSNTQIKFSVVMPEVQGSSQENGTNENRDISAPKSGIVWLDDTIRYILELYKEGKRSIQYFDYYLIAALALLVINLLVIAAFITLKITRKVKEKLNNRKISQINNSVVPVISNPSTTSTGEDLEKIKEAESKFK